MFLPFEPLNRLIGFTGFGVTFFLVKTKNKNFDPNLFFYKQRLFNDPLRIGDILCCIFLVKITHCNGRLCEKDLHA